MHTLDNQANLSISIENIVKHFGKKIVLDGINLNVPVGQIYGISGANGAGKSILLRIICGWVLPNNGEVRILGQRIGKDTNFPPSTGALIDNPGFLLRYSGRRNLELLARIQDKISDYEIAEAMRVTGLDAEDNSPVSTYSNGMRQRLGFAQAIMEKPKVLILDEPTDAIDQAGWRNIYEQLLLMREAGTAILLASNKLDEIEILCDAAYILDKGKLELVKN